MRLISFFKLVRFPNLLIVVATQYFIQYMLLAPAFEANSLFPTLPDFPFALFVFTTVLIAAGGYIINDILDYDIDLVNKPEAVLIRKFISEKLAWRSYFGLFFLGLGLSVYLALYVENLTLVLIFPVAFTMLGLYSIYFKKWPLAGNFIVSLFCAFVPGVVLFAERESFRQLFEANSSTANLIGILIGGYLVFAFLSTFIREIIKDIEDIHGDKQINCRTLPLVYGVRTAKWLVGGLSVLLLTSVLLFSQWLFIQGEIVGLFYSLTGVAIPIVYFISKLITAKEKHHFSRLSRLAKFIMLTGLLLLVVIWKF